MKKFKIFERKTDKYAKTITFFRMCAGGFHCTRLSLTFLNILYLAFSITIIAVACWARNVGMIISPPIIGGKKFFVAVP